MIFLATGDRDDYHNVSVSAGIYRSTNGGLNWLPSNEGLDYSGFFQISKILINPTDPDIAYLATSRGLYKTTNATTNCEWTPLSDPLVYQQYFRNILFKPDGTYSILYASGKDIIRSYNSGNTWGSITVPYGLDFTSSTFNPYIYPVRINIEVTPASPEKIYAVSILSDTDGQLIWNSNRKHYLFSFNGASWDIQEPLIGDSYFLYGISEAWLALTASPINSNIIFFGNVITWRSFNGGEDCENIYGYDQLKVHPDCHDLKFSPCGEYLYLATDGGFYKMTNPETPEPLLQSNFDKLNNGLAIGTITKIGISENDDDLALAGFIDCGKAKYDPNYQTEPWKRIAAGGDGGEQIIDFLNNDTMYTCSQKNTIQEKSFIRGGYWHGFDSWRPYDNACNGEEGAEFIADYVINPDHHNVLYFNYTDLYKYIFKTLNTIDVTKVSSFDDDFGLNCFDPLTAICLAPNQVDHIYVAAENMIDDFNSNFKLFKTTTGGYDNGCTENCWTEITPTNAHYITGIAVSPYNENEIWISYSGYDEEKIKHFDGTEWSDFSSGIQYYIPVNNIIYENGSIDGLFAATDVGVYYRDITMEAWEPYMNNLPNVMVSELEISYKNNTIKAGTFGRGLWESSLPCEYLNLNLEITSDQTWNVPMRVHSNLVVKSGKTLTIKNGAAVYFHENSKIIVERGGHLIIDGGTLTNGCEGLWKGIEVWGDPAHQATSITRAG